MYSIKIPKGYIGYTFQEFATEIMTKRGRTSNPLLVVGVERKGELHTNPRKRFLGKPFTIELGDEAVVLAWKEPTKLPHSSRMRVASYFQQEIKPLTPKLEAKKGTGAASKQKIEEVPPKHGRKVSPVEKEKSSPPSAL